MCAWKAADSARRTARVGAAKPMAKAWLSAEPPQGVKAAKKAPAGGKTKRAAKVKAQPTED